MEDDTTSKLVLSKDDLEHKGRILVEAEEIREDDVVYRAVTQHMKKKARKISRIADLRDIMANEDLSTKNDHMPNKVETKEVDDDDDDDESEEKD